MGIGDAGARGSFFDPKTATPAFGALVDVRDPVIIGAGSKRLFFSAANSDPNVLCWVSDGTRVGTKAVVLPMSLTLGAAVVLDDMLIFVGDQGSSRGLWVTDGTAEGTKLLKASERTNPMHFGSQATEHLMASAGRAWLLLDDGTIGPELYVTDGTEAGTSRLTNDVPAPESMLSDQLIPYQGGAALRVTEPAVGGTHRYHFWLSDGTVAGTQHLKQDLANYGFSNTLVERIGDRVFFSYETVAEGEEVWVWNGAATHVISTNPGVSSAEPFDHAVVGDRLVFAANDPSGVGVFSIEPGASTATRLGPTKPAATRPFVGLAGSQLVFSVRPSASINEVWSTDGTVNGTNRLTSAIVDPGVPGFRSTQRGSLLVFPARRAFNVSESPWVTDGTPQGTHELIATFGSGRLGAAVLLADRVWLAARTHADGYQLVTTDGTPSGTQVLTAPGATNISNPLGISGFGSSMTPRPSPVALGDAVFFVANYFGQPQLFRFDTSLGFQIFGNSGANPVEVSCADVPMSYIGEVQFDTMCAAAACYRRTGQTERAVAVCASMSGFVGPTPNQCPACQ